MDKEDTEKVCTQMPGRVAGQIEILRINIL